MKYTKEQIQKMRNVRIYKILGLPDDGKKKAICCPFHQEKTPSCYIYPDNSFYCFGCSAHGKNAVDFLSLFKDVKFQDVLSELSNYI